MAEHSMGNGENTEEEPHVIQVCKVNKGKLLDLTHRKLKCIPSGVFQLSHIQGLYMEDNLLEEIPLQLAENLVQLTWLDLRHNKLKFLPSNISLLLSLKSLLLEGNEIKKLPRELGLLKHLTGLNLKDNPLEFPAKSIVEQGCKAILKYLREQYDVSYQMHRLELDDSDTKNPLPSCVENNAETDTSDKYPSSLRRIKLHSAPIHRHGSGKSGRNSNISDKYIKRDEGYMRNEPVEVKYFRQVEDAERKKFNEKVDSIIQKQRNKVALDQWQKETARLQRFKYRSKSAKKHEIHLPYGNDISPMVKTEKGEPSESVDGNLEERIKEHVRYIKEWREKDKNTLTAEEELEIAKQNLEKAQQLQKAFEKQRPAELRAKAFNANDYIPVPHITKHNPKK